MPLALVDDDRQRAIALLRHYADDEMGVEIGDLAAGLLLDFILQEIGPSLYNRGLKDAQAYLSARLADLDVDLGQFEFPGGRR